MPSIASTRLCIASYADAVYELEVGRSSVSPTRLGNVVLFGRTSGRTSLLFGVIFLLRTTSYITTFHAYYFSTFGIMRTVE